MKNLNYYLEIMAEKISPTDTQIKEADAVYALIIGTLMNANIISHEDYVIKQGSYKTRTLTVTKASDEIDLDILLSADYDHPNDVKSVMSRALISAGFKTNSKTRVIEATKNGFKVDILPCVLRNDNVYPPKKFLIHEKGTTHQKTIDPIGLLKWIESKKLQMSVPANTPLIKREIDREGYNKQQANSNLNKAIRILKAMAYEFNLLNPSFPMKSFEIEMIALKNNLQYGSIQEIIGQIIRAISSFADRGENLYNPVFDKELLINFEGKTKYVKYLDFVTSKLKELTPARAEKLVKIAGIVISVSPLAAGSFVAGTIPPHHGK